MLFKFFIFSFQISLLLRACVEGARATRLCSCSVRLMRVHVPRIN